MPGCGAVPPVPVAWWEHWCRAGSAAGLLAAAGCGEVTPLSCINIICILREQVATTSFAISVPATCPFRNGAF